jgi:hypothetical protein
MHIRTKKILCLGVCCIKRICLELANEMEKSICLNAPACFNNLQNKKHAYEQLGFCSLECLEQKDPENKLIKKCKRCKTYLYPPSKYTNKKFCFRSCELEHKVFLKKLESLYAKKFFEFEERTRRFELEKEKLIRDEYKRNLMDPSVTLLCDCEKYYIPYKVRITQKDPLCFVCFTRKVKKEPITYVILQWMAKNDLVHIN